MSFSVGLKICVITAGIKNYKSIIKKKKQKLDKIVLLAKTRSNSIKVLISRAVIDSYISYDDFVLKNYMLKEYDNLKEETKNLNTSTLHRRF